MIIKIRINEATIDIDADSYMPISEENAVQFYRDKSDLDYIPPIKVDDSILSNFGKKILLNESEE